MSKHSPLVAPLKFQNALIAWFNAEGKTYPWRETSDPWHILISEVMLQQTQVSTVLNKQFFTRFIEKFPTPVSIASASEQEILSAWEGLGYYRRVRNLQQAAIAICKHHAGIFPREYEKILALPGIGKYTAGAVSSFAYGIPQPIVDANVARVFARVFDFQVQIDSSQGQKQLWSWADQLLSQKNPKLYNSALMELGQQVCTNKSPKCLVCPINSFCTAKQPENLPLKKAAKQSVLVEEFALFCIDDQKRILLQQESSQNRRAGMWKLPLRDPSVTENLPLLNSSTYGITHHKVTLKVFHSSPKNLPLTMNPSSEKWHHIEDLQKIPMPSPFRKVLNTLLKDHF